jgi:hypothetical protein
VLADARLLDAHQPPDARDAHGCGGPLEHRGAPPGEYFAVASTLIDESDLRRRDRLTTLASLGTPFSVDSDEAKPTVSLKVNTLIPTASR